MTPSNFSSESVNDPSSASALGIAHTILQLPAIDRSLIISALKRDGILEPVALGANCGPAMHDDRDS